MARRSERKITDSGWLEKKNWQEPLEGSSKRKNQPTSKPIEKNERKKTKIDTNPPSFSTKPQGLSEKCQTKEQMLLILKNFDLDPTFGPVIGYSRMERFERALKFNLKPEPSPQIKEILEDNLNDPEFTTCCWDQYRGLTMK